MGLLLMSYEDEIFQLYSTVQSLSWDVFLVTVFYKLSVPAMDVMEQRTITLCTYLDKSR